MSESDDTAEETEAQQEQPQAPARQGGGGFLSEEEKEVMRDWLVYVVGVFAAIGVGIGLNAVIQDQWDHNLVDASGAGLSAVASASMMNAGMITLIIPLSILLLTLFGVVAARHVDNEDQTAYKLVAAASILSLPVVTVITGILVLIPIDNVDLEFANTIVSALGAGIAAAVASAIVVWLTENQAPDALQ